MPSTRVTRRDGRRLSLRTGRRILDGMAPHVDGRASDQDWYRDVLISRASNMGFGLHFMHSGRARCTLTSPGTPCLCGCSRNHDVQTTRPAVTQSGAVYTVGAWQTRRRVANSRLGLGERYPLDHIEPFVSVVIRARRAATLPDASMIAARCVMLEFDDLQHIIATRVPALTGRYEFLSFRQPAQGRAWLTGILDKVASVQQARESDRTRAKMGVRCIHVARTSRARSG